MVLFIFKTRTLYLQEETINTFFLDSIIILKITVEEKTLHKKKIKIYSFDNHLSCLPSKINDLKSLKGSGMGCWFCPLFHSLKLYSKTQERCIGLLKASSAKVQKRGREEKIPEEDSES